MQAWPKCLTIGFERVGEQNSVVSLIFSSSRGIPAHDTVTIRATGRNEVA